MWTGRLSTSCVKESRSCVDAENDGASSSRPMSQTQIEFVYVWFFFFISSHHPEALERNS